MDILSRDIQKSTKEGATEKVVFDRYEIVKVALQQEVSRFQNPDMIIGLRDCFFFVMG